MDMAKCFVEKKFYMMECGKMVKEFHNKKLKTGKEIK
jgi:hypothetical protein